MKDAKRPLRFADPDAELGWRKSLLDDGVFLNFFQILASQIYLESLLEMLRIIVAGLLGRIGLVSVSYGLS